MPEEFALLRIGLRPTKRTDIENVDDEATITRPFAAIGRDAHEMPDPVDRLDGPYDCLATRGHPRQILGNGGNERMRKIRERPADIMRPERDYACYCRCEPPEAHRAASRKIVATSEVRRTFSRSLFDTISSEIFC